MSSYAELAVYNRHGQLTALVEIKNKLGTSRAWAAQLRHNLLAHGGYDTADFFLLATPDWLYLWHTFRTLFRSSSVNHHSLQIVRPISAPPG